MTDDTPRPRKKYIQFNFVLTADDAAMIADLGPVFNTTNKSEIVRQALKRAAIAEGIRTRPEPKALA